MPRTNVVGTTAPSGSGAQRCAQAGEREHRTDSTARDISPTNDGRNSLTATPTQLIGLIKAHIAKGDKAKEKADQHYIAAGQHLKTLKARHAGTWTEWEALLKEKIGIGKSRASELMQIADGTKTAAEVAAATTERSQRHRALSPLRNGENADDPETSAETMKAEFAASDGKAAAPSKAEPPPTASESSWRAELTTEGGERWVNGVRFKTKAEAGLFVRMGISDLMLPPWTPEDHEPLIVVMTRVLASADAANCSMRYPKKHRKAGQLCNMLSFSHGECRLHVWHREDETEPSCPAATAPTDDGLDIPPYLRREPKAVSS
jgi:hypothetical protein